MSDAYSKISACAESIFKIVGPCSDADLMLCITGVSPAMVEVDLEDLIPPALYERIDASTRHRISCVLQQRLSATRIRLERQYVEMVSQYRSMSHLGMADMDLEACLVRIFETRYDNWLEDVRKVLSKILAQRTCSIADNRNTRGGFGDVSPPHHSETNN